MRPKTRQGWAGMKNPESETGTALVVIEQAVEGPRMPFRVSRPDAPFVAQLIATAAGVSQARILRRATQADALRGYGCAAARRVEPLRSNGDCVSLVA